MRLLTLARDLKRRNARERQGLFVVEGVRAVEELLRSDLKLRGILVSPSLGEHERGGALRDALENGPVAVQEASAADFASASDTETPQGVLAVAEIPRRSLADLPAATTLRLLVLDAIQDPGNVGTILRTGAALGAYATVALPGTVDLWNAKVVRSAMGAHFHYPAFGCTWADLDTFLAEREVGLWGADTAGEPLDAILHRDGRRPDRLAVAFGNEGSGLSPHVRAHADRLVALPIARAVESLNVAVAAGIILYELRR